MGRVSRLWICLALLPLAACGTDEVDTPHVEDVIARKMTKEVDDVVRVSCPSGVTWESGRDFHCIARDGQGAKVRVTVSMETDDGQFSWTVD